VHIKRGGEVKVEGYTQRREEEVREGNKKRPMTHVKGRQRGGRPHIKVRRTGGRSYIKGGRRGQRVHMNRTTCDQRTHGEEVPYCTYTSQRVNVLGHAT
jgi:hypothetical protein